IVCELTLPSSLDVIQRVYKRYSAFKVAYVYINQIVFIILEYFLYFNLFMFSPYFFFFFQAEDGIRDATVTGVQTCALPISPGQHTGGRFGLARLADSGPDPLVQTGWSLEIGGSGTNGRPQSLMVFIDLRAGWATAQVAFDLHASDYVQLTIQIPIEQFLRILAAHLWGSLVRQFIRHCRSRARARAKLDITVPTGMSATSAISL